MRYKVAGLALVIVAAACATTMVQAQEAETPRKSSTLADRLDRLRKDIFGESEGTSNRSEARPSRTNRAGSAAHRSSRSSRSTARTASRDRTAAPTDLKPETTASQPPAAGRRVPRRVRPADTTSEARAPTARSTASRSATSQQSSPRTATASTSKPQVNVGRPADDSARRLVPQSEAASPYPAGFRRPTRTAAAPRRTTRAESTESSAAKTPVKVEIPSTPTAEVSRRPAASRRREAPRSESVVNRARPTAEPAREEVAQPAVDDSEDEDLVLFAQRSPLLRVETLGPRRIVVGKESTYKIRMQNLGEVGANGVVVTVRLPRDAEVLATTPSHGEARRVSGTKGSPDHLEWRLDEVEGRSHEHLVVKLIPRDSREFDLAVNWTSLAASSQTRIEVQEPKLHLALNGPGEVLYGDTKVYRLTVSNPGTGTAENVMIKLMPIDGGTQPAAEHRLGTVLAGDSKVLEIELTARQAGQVNIKAMVSGDGDLRSEVDEKVLVRRADLKVEVAGPPMKYSGTRGRYTVHVSNPGDATADSIEVVASLPAGVTDVKPSDRGEVDDSSRRVVWTIGPLSPGQTRQLDLAYTVKSAGSNVLKVAAETEGDVAHSGAITTHVEATADLKLEVIDSTGPFAVGEEMTYTIRVRNRGSKEANAVELFGFFSEGLEPVEVQQGDGEMSPGQVVFEPIEELRAGGEKVFKIVAKAEQGGNHIFHAEVRCRPLGTRLVAEDSTLFYDMQARTPVKPAAPASPRTAIKSKAPAVIPSTKPVAPAEAEPAAVAPSQVPSAYTPPAVSPTPAVSPKAAEPLPMKEVAPAATESKAAPAPLAPVAKEADQAQALQPAEPSDSSVLVK